MRPVLLSTRAGRLSLWWGGAALALLIFVRITREFLEGDVSALDRAIQLAVVRSRTPWLTFVAVDVTALGSITLVVLLTQVIARPSQRPGKLASRSEVPVGSLASVQSAPPTRVLVVDDNVINQRFAMRLLEKHGCVIVVASNWRAALDILEREAFDVILMDVRMPEMDGFETTVAIRNKEKITGGHVPILAMTALAMKQDEQRCVEAGMDTYVSKPFRSHELLEVIGAYRGVPPGPHS